LRTFQFFNWAPLPLIRHCEERSDEAIQLRDAGLPAVNWRLPRACGARNDGRGDANLPQSSQ